MYIGGPLRSLFHEFTIIDWCDDLYRNVAFNPAFYFIIVTLKISFNFKIYYVNKYFLNVSNEL